MKLLKLLIVLCLLTAKSAAMEVIYPKTLNSFIESPSTFILGNVSKGGSLTINSNPVDIHKNGSFTYFVPLKQGLNTFILDSSEKGEKKQITITLTRPNAQLNIQKIKFLPLVTTDTYVKCISIKNNAPLRDAPNGDATRITHVEKDTVLYIDGTQGEFSRVILSPSNKLWVASSHIQQLNTVSKVQTPILYSTKVEEDTNAKTFIYKLSEKIPFVLLETGTPPSILKLNLNKLIFNDEEVDFSRELSADNKLFGYDAYYKGTDLVITIKKSPALSTFRPLKHMRIFVDPGHGGEELGAIGLLGDCEKDINLDIALKLKKSLAKRGANVTISRTNDKFLSLEERINMAKASKSDISISVHSNALPDNKNPLDVSGTSVYYYYPQAKLLADTIKKQMVSDLKTKDDGTIYRSFALTRMTSPVSILVEVAYMINPQDFANLKKPRFRKKAAKAITKGIENYCKELLQ